MKTRKAYRSTRSQACNTVFVSIGCKGDNSCALACRAFIARLARLEGQ